MAKTKSAFVCNDCGADYRKWQGQCSACSAWNTLSEVRIPGGNSGSVQKVRGGFAGTTARVQKFSEIDLVDLPRFSSGFAELDRVLGGGFVPGSAILIGGHPGAGKSTLLLQTLCALAARAPALYVTGEESPQQIAMRAKRLGLETDSLQLMAETDVDAILSAANEHKPKIMVVDSIQVVHSDALHRRRAVWRKSGTARRLLTRYAKQTGTVLILVGHVTKDGSLAGPKVLEHMIDCSVLLEGEQDSRYRTLRGQKNRFGAVNELGVFAMTDGGLKEVSESICHFPRASRYSSAWHGSRCRLGRYASLLVEIQALVDASNLGNPRRVAVGFEQNRLAMLLAVLHRHVGLHVGDQDVFANVVGGVRIAETSGDLSLLLAVVSSLAKQDSAKRSCGLR
jgi:DNA repair protein RadA/Sms